MTAAVHIGLGDVAAALALVAVAVAVAVWERTDLEGHIAVVVARSFIQLTAIGYVIKLIFAGGSLVWVALLLAVMVALGAFTAVAGHGSHSTTAAGNLRPAARTGTASGLSEQRADGRLR